MPNKAIGDRNKRDKSPPTDKDDDDILEDSAPEEDLKDIGGFELVDSKERKLPPLPSKRIDPDKAYLFFQWVARLEQEDLNHLAMYLYRSWPLINRRADNPKANTNIEKLFSKEVCTIEYITATHGSGDYKIMVNDVKKTGPDGKGGTIANVYFSIREPDAPPKLLLNELLVNDPKNKQYVDELKARGLLNTDGGIVVSHNAGGNDPQLIGLLTELVRGKMNQPPTRDTSQDIVGGMYAKAVDALMDTVKKQSTADSPSNTVALIAAVKDLIPQPKEDNSKGEFMAMLTLLMNAQSESAKQVASANERMIAVLTKQPDKDPELAMLEKMQMWREMFGSENNGGNIKKSTLEVIAENAAPILGKVMDTVNLYMSMAAYKAQGASGMPAAPIPPPALVSASDVIPEPETEKGNVVEMPKPSNELVMMIAGPGGPLILEALNRGDSGYVFAEHIEGLLGKLTYERLASVSEEQFIEAMKQVPAFWNNVASVEPTVRQFIQEFIAYKDSTEENEPA